MTIKPHKVLFNRRDKYEKSIKSLERTYLDNECNARKFGVIANSYISELERYIPNEIIDDHTYSELFRQLLSLCSSTFRPDHFDSCFGGLLQWFDLDFMEWLLAHQGELKRQLTWKQICDLQFNFGMAKVLNMPEMTLREMWNFNDSEQAKIIKKKFEKHF